MTEKHWTYMTDREIKKLQRESWPVDGKHGPIALAVSKGMRAKTPDEYRLYLMNVDRARSRA